MNKNFETPYGYFTEDGTAYIIKNYRTPKPWVNVISNGEYGLVVSQVNGGFSWITHSNLNRLTRWQQDLVRDDWGKFIYLRDDQTGEYWSPTFQPVKKELDDYRCTHGIGYTEFFSVYKNIEARLRIFVPFDESLEIWTLTLKNLGEQSRELSVFTYLEWCLGAAPDSHREFHKTFIETEFVDEQQVLLARKRLWEIPTTRGHWNTEWNRTAYFACNEPVEGFESDKEAFIGNLRDLAAPLALETGCLSGGQGKWGDAIGALQKKVRLKPNSEKSIHFFLGAENEPEQIQTILEKYRQPEEVEFAFQKMQKRWNDLLTTTTVETPDEALNFMTNTWLKYQAISGRLWARAAYYQQSGAFGFRDQLQDSQIFLSIDPNFTRRQILLHARHQFKSGKVLHWWHPIIEQGLDANMTDDLLWLPFVTIQYLKETADWAILEEKVVWYDDQENASLLEHCLRAIDLVLERFSERGLPLILAGDWNDGLSGVGLDGNGESIWLAHFLYLILNEIQPVLEKRGLNNKSEIYQQRAVELQRSLNHNGWDGEWFWRASKDSGELLGSKHCHEGQIFLNPQTWAVIANSTTKLRQNTAMDAVEKWLLHDVGPLLFYPAYTKPDAFIGYLTRYAPGIRENGGIYTHAATWAIRAESILKRNELVYEIYRKLNPIYKGQQPNQYCAEPYVTPGNIDGPASPHSGRGGWTWYTGSAAWLHKVTLDNLLGIRADYNGLVIDPCLPGAWKKVKVKRLFRGTVYEITIQNSTEEAKIYVDGEEIQGNLVWHREGKERVVVEVRSSTFRLKERTR